MLQAGDSQTGKVSADNQHHHPRMLPVASPPWRGPGPCGGQVCGCGGGGPLGPQRRPVQVWRQLLPEAVQTTRCESPPLPLLSVEGQALHVGEHQDESAARMASDW